MSYDRSRLAASVLVLVLGAACSGGTDPGDNGLTHPSGDAIVFLPLAGRPHGVATAANGKFVVSQIDGSAITFGQLAGNTQSFTSSVGVGSTPAHVAIDRTGTRAYTANQFAGSLSVVDAIAAERVTTVALTGEGFNLLVSPSGQRVYVTTGNGNLQIIDAGTNASIETIAVGASANGLAYHAASNTLYVSSRDAATITAIDADDNTVARSYPVSGKPQRIAVSANNGELYIASEIVGLEILNLATGSRTSVPGVAAAAVGLAQSPDGAEIWVTHPPLGLVTVVDRVARTVKRIDEIGASPRNVAFDQSGAVAIITDEGNKVYFVR